MKNKNSKHHLSIHQRLERLAHHRAILSCILSFMAIGFIKYETQVLYVLHDAYNQGFGMVSVYTHHDEITRMPVQYGSSMRGTLISGE
jgi:ssDNA-specific exonuclease RecJ